MRDKNRISEITHDLERLWKQYPDLRLGQLLENFVFTKGQRGDKTSVALFYQEDDETQKKILMNTDFEHRRFLVRDETK
jgi:uncharacterized protein YihD (DUF1040 family)